LAAPFLAIRFAGRENTLEAEIRPPRKYAQTSARRTAEYDSFQGQSLGSGLESFTETD
jgi:hypothetical protein